MSSVIHYRFKAGSSDWSRIQFEGHVLSLYELKKQITAAKKLNPISDQTSGEGGGRTLNDFELVFTNFDTGEEYHGDTATVPKNASIIVKRVPSLRVKTLRLEAEPVGGGLDGLFTTTGAARLAPHSFDLPVAKRLNFGPGPMSSSLAMDELRRSRSLEQANAENEFGEDPLDESSYQQREEEKQQQLLKERQQQQFQQQQQTIQQQEADIATRYQSTSAQPTPSNPSVPTPTEGYQRPAPSRPPPAHYICHNCGQGKHWKQNCPLPMKAGYKPTAHVNSELVRAVGASLGISNLPPSMVMQAIGQTSGNTAANILSAYSNRGSTGQLSALQQQLQQRLPSSSTPSAVPAVPVAPVPPPVTTPPDLTCTLCHRLFTNPMVVPCCFTSFCDECIRQALVVSSPLQTGPSLDSKCPRCGNDTVAVEQLRPNNVMARRVKTERERMAAGPGAGSGTTATTSTTTTTQQPTPMQVQPPSQQVASLPQPSHSSIPYQQPQSQPSRSQPPPYQPKRKITTYDDDEDYSVQRR